MATVTSHPDTLSFLKVREDGKPLTLRWDAPPATCAQVTVFATANPFPEHLASALFSGKMRQFIDEVNLDPTATAYQVARAERFYAVVWIDQDGRAEPVANLREPGGAPARGPHDALDLRAATATQVRTYLRARYRPGLVELRDEAVHLWIRDLAPNAAAFARMASGDLPPDFVLAARGDGFIDTVTESEWRKHYVALVVGRDGVQRPLDLELGGFVRLEEPMLLEPGGATKLSALLALIRDQILLDLQRRSVTAEELSASLRRAEDLMPFNSTIADLRRQARARFPGASF